VVILLVLAALTGDATRTKGWTRSAFFGILLFFVIAGLVHGTSHEGRIGAGDSFNRVAFEILPIVLWFAGAIVARILAPAAEPPDAGSEADTPTVHAPAGAVTAEAPVAETVGASGPS
jgi:hypothetical protein